MIVLNNNPSTFVIGYKGFEERFDVNYYLPEYVRIKEKLKNGPFPEIKNLGDIVDLSKEKWIKPDHGNFEYVEISDIDILTAQITQSKTLNVEDAPSRAQRVIKKDDIIISTTRPYRGAIALVTEKYDGYICSTGFAILRNLKIPINRKYLLYFLHSIFGLKQMEQRMTGGNYPAILPSQLLKIGVSLPPDEIQDQIVELMEEGLVKKEEIEEKSKNLINSIDDYLLNELNIAFPEIEDNILTYEIGCRFLKDNRLDAKYWEPKFRKIEDSIRNGSHETVQFGELIEKIVNGLDFRTFSDEGTKYIRVGNIKPFEIDETDVKHIPLPLEDVSKDIILNEGDILLTRKGSFGIATSVKNVNSYIISSEIFRILISIGEVNPDYIVAILNSSLGKNQFSRKSVGAIMGSLSQDSIKTVLIPLPPKAKQDEIAKEINDRLRKSKELFKLAKSILDNTNSKIVKLISGEEND